MANLWHLFVANWAIPLASWVFGTFVGATFRWFYPSRKEWKEQRRLKAEQKIDERVIDAMKGDSSQTFPVGRSPRFQASDVAKVLDLEVDVVFDSLERLERKGRVHRGGHAIPGIPPSWTLNSRQ